MEDLFTETRKEVEKLIKKLIVINLSSLMLVSCQAILLWISTEPKNSPIGRPSASQPSQLEHCYFFENGMESSFLSEF